jgi:hypothetical protein
MEALRLALSDCTLLAARYSEHSNSHRQMSSALRDAGAADVVDRLFALRQLESRFDVDLGLLCHWYARRDARETHPVERAIITYVTTHHEGSAGEELYIRVDRVRALREFLEESRLVGEPES